MRRHGLDSQGSEPWPRAPRPRGAGVQKTVTAPSLGKDAPPLRVLHVTHELSLTGGPRLALNGLRMMRDTVAVFTVSATGGPLEAEFALLGPVHVLNRVPHRMLRRAPQADSVLAKGFGRVRAPAVGVIARRWDPDVIYVNSVAAITLVPRLHIPDLRTIIYVHELGAALDRLSASHRELLASVPDRYMAVSNAVAAELGDQRGIPRDRIAVVPPMVDTHRIHEMADERLDRAGEGGDPVFLVGGAGNPHWTKGIEQWLLVARELTDRLGSNRVRFEWVGVRDNHAGIEFRAMIRKLHLEANVRLVPVTPNPYPRFRAFDVFAMTSWEESASLVVLENMALEVPVVCFRGSGGPPELLGETGVVIDRFSPSEMADSIAHLLASPDERTRIGALQRARVADLNDPHRVSSMLHRELSADAGTEGG